jgi:hypothetical protein
LFNIPNKVPKVPIQVNFDCTEHHVAFMVDCSVVTNPPLELVRKFVQCKTHLIVCNIHQLELSCHWLHDA